MIYSLGEKQQQNQTQQVYNNILEPTEAWVVSWIRIIISVMLFSIPVCLIFPQNWFPQLEVVQETLIHLEEIGLYFVSELKKLLESLDFVFMGFFAKL